MKVLRYLAAAAVAALVALAPASPALAHDGPLTLDVAGDGAGGVTVRAVFTADQHPVEEGVPLVLTATGADGRTVGPIQLNPAPEGRGFYISGAVLTPGAWDVTVSSSQPHPGKGTAKVEATVAQQPPPPPAAERDGSDLTGRFGWLWWLLGAVVVVAALGATVRARAQASSSS